MVNKIPLKKDYVNVNENVYEETIDLNEMFHAILKHIKLIVFLCLLFGVANYIKFK